MDNQYLYDINYIKYQKYKNKYLNLKNQIGSSGTCKYNKDTSRQPSNCDRIIYKSKNINFPEYNVITQNNFDLIQFSDHKMVYGIFDYKNEKYMIISWNMGAFDRKFDKKYESYIESHIKKFIDNIIKIKNIQYLIFSFQESTNNSLFIKILKNMIEQMLGMTLLKQILSNPKLTLISSSSKYYVQLLVFAKKPNIKVDSSGYYDFKVNNYDGQSKKSSIQQSIKNLLGTKSYVYIKMNDLMIVSTHFPIDTKQNDLGNNLRILALEEIDNKFNSENNLIIIGDLNFRKLNNIDQLDKLLTEKSHFREAGKLFETTCKYEECKLKCDKTACSIINKDKNEDND
jgi:hypothetical protein